MNRKYQIIYADPPWKATESGTGIRGTANLGDRYNGVLSIEELCNLPIESICDVNCILFLWVTFPRLQEGLELMKAWGFKYKSLGFTWIKKNKCADSLFWGMGYYTRQNPEICLIGLKGKMARQSRSIHCVFESPIEEHSKKPSIIRDKIVEIAGDLHRIELFARQKTEGWDVWGNEVESDIVIESKGV
jgi:N6-adenosine-specific RNA methylase IME4